MKILPDVLLKERNDVIVVGAGLGGMTAASLLAKRGLSVLLIDQQNKPGGALWRQAWDRQTGAVTSYLFQYP